MASHEHDEEADPGAVERHPEPHRSGITVTDERAARRAVRAAALGNAMEWFDFGLYSYLAVTLGHVFFPSGNSTVQLLSSFATFAVAFLVRPVGGTVFGPMGDRIGRKKVLALTMIMMAIGTFAIGLIPSYAAIGFWAPALLILFRLVQGFSTGGEYGGASTFIAEYAPDKRRGYYGSFLEFGTLSGYIGAAGLVTALHAWAGADAMEAWGWRVPFLIAGPLGLIGLYLRLRLDETPAFQRLAPEAVTTTVKADLGRIFRQYWRTLILCVALVGAYNVTDYMLLSYMPTYLSDELGYSDTHGLLILLGVMAFLLLIINRIGILSDRFGRKPLLMTGMLGFLLLSLPTFLLIGQGGVPAITAGVLMLGLSLVCLLGTMSAALPALFPTEVRYGALSAGYNLSVSLFGGTTPLVITALISATGSNLTPAYYAMAAALVGVVAVARIRETAQLPLPGSPPSVATEAEAAQLRSDFRT
ncbi:MULTISPECIES: MFS transporter [unclassified Streptomyces]|uniref:MFS transporter n=1 Tax=unclassified Streptomyces TaxID=2593676 RepID=UPI00081DC8DC|nr:MULTISPECIES: MFS transporter [unclassified Streptomyces]MYZ38725.1 MFS transporter [Streptomyces sp. SID4917]SCG00046.1 MFS transporter, MHS family, proline/betaine transporter [Streptomyces sp. MnatMP-M17]